MPSTNIFCQLPPSLYLAFPIGPAVTVGKRWLGEKILQTMHGGKNTAQEKRMDEFNNSIWVCPHPKVKSTALPL